MGEAHHHQQQSELTVGQQGQVGLQISDNPFFQMLYE